MDHFFKQVDAFRTSKFKDIYLDGSISGGFMTMIAYFIMGSLFFCEMWAYLSPRMLTEISMDMHQADLLEIHFDITMHKLPCSAADVIVWDTFRESPLPITSKSVTKTNINHVGDELGVHDDENDPVYLVEHTEDHPELDTDWDTSSPVFEKLHFEDVVRYHDFTFINFYAEWCVHCRQFSPIWNETEMTTDKMVFKDGDSNRVIVKQLRINCVDFPTICREQNIRWYPSIRLYKRDLSFDNYGGDRQKDPLLAYLSSAIGNSHHIVNKDHSIHDEGCRLEGAIRTLRVPGEFHIQAKAGSVDLEPSMTNVSHTVHSLVFLDDGESFLNFLTNNQGAVPPEVMDNAQPFSGKTFIANNMHEAPQHYLQVVSTIFQLPRQKPLVIYQASAQSQIKMEKVEKIPQAKFSYTLSPMSVIIKQDPVPLYEFLTQISAIIGGTYTVISLIHSTYDTVSKTYKNKMGVLD